MKQRVLTAVVLVPLFLAAMFFLPQIAWQLLLCVPIALGASEWARLAKFRKVATFTFVAVLVATCLAFVVAFASKEWTGAAGALSRLLFMGALLFWAIVAPLWLYRGWRVAQPVVLGLVGWFVLIPAWLGAAFLQNAPWMLLAILAIVWIADTAAYFAGRKFGRHKLAPLISPGKTWEGVVGAFAAVLVYGFAVGFLLQPAGNVYDRIVMLIFVCALTVLSIVGDLFESWIKRVAGAKDSGTLLPGHGGVLDRIDSLTAALPFAALYFLPMLGPA
ncbi:MAG TPA: phosphatidate cytidylyltransferase [Burkholderiales bacterium]|nr:phosphatidate cytidylyltransferase [Burkholderiales bacterium]